MKGIALADLFEKHAEKLAVDPEPTARYRSLSYKKTSELIAKTFGENQVTKAEVEKLKITDYMKNKILDTVKLGHIESSSQAKPSSQRQSDSKVRGDTDQSKKIIDELATHSGIGTKKAEEFYKAGVRKIDDLLEKKFEHLLTSEIKAFMEMKPMSTIPHEDIKLIEKALLNCTSKSLELIFVGSYRRKKPFSSDVDVMLVSDNKQAEEDFKELMKCITSLADRFLIYAEGPDKISGIGDFSRTTKKKPKSFIIKMDVFRATPATKLPYLLYSTGSKENNVAMRGKAKRMGMLLNQNGLYKNDKRVDLKFTSEKDYYEALGMTYKEPHER